MSVIAWRKTKKKHILPSENAQIGFSFFQFLQDFNIKRMWLQIRFQNFAKPKWVCSFSHWWFGGVSHKLLSTSLMCASSVYLVFAESRTLNIIIDELFLRNHLSWCVSTANARSSQQVCAINDSYLAYLAVLNNCI